MSSYQLPTCLGVLHNASISIALLLLSTYTQHNVVPSSPGISTEIRLHRSDNTMCSPDVMAHVRHEIASGNRISRRSVVRAAAIGSVSATLAADVFAQTPQATPVDSSVRTAIVDLTHTMTPDVPIWPGNEPFSHVAVKTFDSDGFYAQRVSFWEHTGTHIDAPMHFNPDGETADKLDVGTLWAPLAVIDITAKAADDPDASVTVDDIQAYEAQYGELPSGVLVAMNSGWQQFWDDAEAFVNMDAGGVQHYPGFHPDAAEYLTSQRHIVGVAVDTLSQDPGNSTDFGTHVTILGVGKYGIEGLANVAAMDPAGSTVFVGAPKWADASGGPARVIGLNRTR